MAETGASLPLPPDDPRRAALGVELHRLGYTVVPHGTEVCVRLPLLCSVRIREEAGRVVYRPKFGPFSRTGSLLITSGASLALIGAAASWSGTPAAIGGAAMLGIVALAHEVCRFVITEGCLTRLQDAVERMRK